MKINERYKETSILELYQFNKISNKKHFYKIFYFFVINNLIDKESFSYFQLKEYGWNSNIIEGEIKDKLDSLEIFNNIIIETDLNKLDETMLKNKLSFNNINITSERAVIRSNKKDCNIYELLYIKIRNFLAHGNFRIQKNSQGILMVIAEDYNSRGYLEARIVIKLITLVRIVDIVDKNKIIE